MTPYDEVAYPSRPFRQTHPAQLSVAAALLGLPYAPPATSRVLEIGCGEGANLVAMAVGYPDARFVGFDLAQSAIATGARVVDRLGLSNIRLEARDILQPSDDLGIFDYIIAHGVYSWTPGPVREALMRSIGERLAPDGLAFVSYNALPGCHLRMILREMLLHHLSGVEGFEARLAAARACLDFFIANAPNDDATAVALKVHARAMLERDPHVLFHDELGSVYHPVYLHEFAAHAEAHGLRFLAESEGQSWREELFPTPPGKAIAGLVGGGVLAIQQYADFLGGRLFRQSILCRAEAASQRRIDLAGVRGLYATVHARAVDPEPDLTSAAPVKFELGSLVALNVDHPGLKQALHALGQAWPRAVAMADLPDDPDVVEGLLQLFTAGHVDLATAPAAATAATPGERPQASPLARLQAALGEPTVSSLEHMPIRFEDPEGRRFLQLLDGSRTRLDLARAMSPDSEPSEAALSQVDVQLGRLAQLALLVA